MPPKKSSRSSSRGRPAAKSPASTKKAAKKTSSSSKSPAPTPKKSAKKAPAKAKKAATPATPAHKMEFDEGANVMARWPGTSLYFKAKVQYVRDDDNEYDVQYEDGTVFTIKAKDVKASRAIPASASGKKSPSRSRSRGRSPGRKSAKSSPGRTPAKSPKSAAPRSSSRSRAPVAAPKPDPTPTRTSTRLAAKKAELSDDESAGSKAIPNPSHPRKARRGLFADLNLDWAQALFFIVLGPTILLSLHKLAKDGVYQLKWPELSRKPADYWDRDSFLAVFTLGMCVRFLNLLPLGTTVRAVSGHEVRMNGFYTLLAVLSVVPALVYRKVDVSFATKNYFHLMTSAVLMSFLSSLMAFVISRWGKRSNANPRGNTGNVIVDYFYGREFNPYLKGDIKLLNFRFSMVALALLNVLLVLHSINENAGKTNPAVIVTAAFQVLYAMDALFFEEYYFFSYDAMNNGFGFSVINSYLSFPFLPTLVTRYIIAANPVLPWFQLAGIALVNALGYVIFRSSETQRCEFAKNPNQPGLRNLRTISTVGGKKIMAGGWWSLVRHPNYLGELLIQWSWVLPAAFVAGRADLLVYYLPVSTTATLMARARDQNARNKRKYGTAWDSYSQEVTSNIIPKVY